MTHDDGRDPLLELLARLPMDAPPAAAVERVRARSHAVLERRRPRQAVAPNRTVGSRLVDGVLFFACFMYLAGAVATAVSLSGLFHY